MRLRSQAMALRAYAIMQSLFTESSNRQAGQTDDSLRVFVNGQIMFADKVIESFEKRFDGRNNGGHHSMRLIGNKEMKHALVIVTRMPSKRFFSLCLFLFFFLFFFRFPFLYVKNRCSSFYGGARSAAIARRSGLCGLPFRQYFLSPSRSPSRHGCILHTYILLCFFLRACRKPLSLRNLFSFEVLLLCLPQPLARRLSLRSMRDVNDRNGILRANLPPNEREKIEFMLLILLFRHVDFFATRVFGFCFCD